MSKYIDVDKLLAEIDYKLHCNGAFDEVGDCAWHYDQGMVDAYKHIKEVITSLQQEIPDKDTIIRICKLHKVWSITAPWENIEDFVTTNWNSKNIV